MKKNTPTLALIAVALLAASAHRLAAVDTINISNTVWQLDEKPLPIAVSGFTGEADQVLRFDLEVVGCKIVGADAAQFQVTGANNGRVEGRLIDLISKTQLLGKAYTGGSVRRQAHALADDIIAKLPNRGKGIAQTHIAYKAEQGGRTEIATADYDGFNAKTVTQDGALVAAPAWVPGRLAIYYTSYKRGNTDIFYQDLSTGARRIFSQYAGLNTSAAPGPEGRKVAMILSKGGNPDVYVCSADGAGLTRLTQSHEDASSPCWSPDGQWVCYATKVGGRRVLSKVPAGGGAAQRIATVGVSSPSEPDWSPDGKWIAFTSQRGGGFDICVVPAAGGSATVLVEGEDPSWAPNSRNLIFVRRGGSGRTLSLLDVPTKQVKDVRRISGSQPSWAK
jgi:TolB protein